MVLSEALLPKRHAGDDFIIGAREALREDHQVPRHPGQLHRHHHRHVHVLHPDHIPDICHLYHLPDMWRKFVHVEKF